MSEVKRVESVDAAVLKVVGMVGEYRRLHDLADRDSGPQKVCADRYNAAIVILGLLLTDGEPGSSDDVVSGIFVANEFLREGHAGVLR